MTQTPIKTYPEMNAQIVGLLQAAGSEAGQYAAARIEELEAEVKRLREQRKQWIFTSRELLAYESVQVRPPSIDLADAFTFLRQIAKETP